MKILATLLLLVSFTASSQNLCDCIGNGYTLYMVQYGANPVDSTEVTFNTSLLLDFLAEYGTNSELDTNGDGMLNGADLLNYLAGINNSLPNLDLCDWNIIFVFSHAWLIQNSFGTQAFLHESSSDEPTPLGDCNLRSFYLEVITDPITNYYFIE